MVDVCIGVYFDFVYSIGNLNSLPITRRDHCNMQINIFYSRNYRRLSDTVESSVASKKGSGDVGPDDRDGVPAIAAELDSFCRCSGGVTFGAEEG
jgi:hypothetical protein